MNTENTNKKVVSTPLVKATIKRNDTGDLLIEMYSPVNWGAFANKTKGTFKLGGVECYVPKDMSAALAEGGVRGAFSTAADFIHDNFPNLSLLLAKDIQKGVVFNFGLVPIPESKMELWKNNLRDQSKTIYLSFMKPVSKTITITTQTIETELHD